MYTHILAKKLEDAFFAEKDLKLINQLKQMKQLEENMDSISKVSGITNNVVLKKLVELNIRPEIVAALSIVPVVEIAWADNKLDLKEKQAILSYSEKHIGLNETSKGLLTQWLERKPPEDMLEAWIHYIRGVCEKLNAEEKKSFKDSFMNQAHTIANASGGFLGIGKTSKEEYKVLKILDSAFD
ncbi:MAG TPA: hypothetical protein VHO50_13635 [Bacteroidales bacterium]|nr:hypothetical protein [Bacteroidales bacterium]